MSDDVMAVIRVRGVHGVRKKTRDTLGQMHLTRSHHCVVLPAGETTKGMLKMVKDYVTWGEANAETIASLEKIGRQPYALHPPRKGFKGSIKRPFPKGALGYRGEKINGLVKAMLPEKKGSKTDQNKLSLTKKA